MVRRPSAACSFLAGATLLLGATVANAAPPENLPAPSEPAPAGPEVPRPTPEDAGAYEDPIATALAVHPGGLRADDVARRASASAPTLEAAHARMDAAAAEVDRANMRFVPRVEGKASYTRLSPVNIGFGGGGAIVGAQSAGPLLAAPCPPELGFPAFAFCVVDVNGGLVGAQDFTVASPLNQFSLQASLGVPFSDYLLTLVPAKKSTESRTRSEKYSRDAERLKVESDARIAYYNWLRTVAQVAVAEQSLQRVQARLQDARVTFEVGLATKADIMRIEAAAASTESALVQSREFRDLSARQLALVMGEASLANPTYQVGEDVLTPTADIPRVDDLDALVREGSQNRLEVKAIREALRGTNYGIRATRASYYPRLDGFAEATYANPNQRFFPPSSQWRGSWSVGLGLTWVLNQALDTKGRVQVLESNERELRANLAAAERGVAAEVASAWTDRRRAQASIELNRRAAEAAAEGYRVAVDLFRVGNATATDILNAEADRVDASLHDVNSRIDLRVANAKLLYATGRLSPVEPTAPSP